MSNELICLTWGHCCISLTRSFGRCVLDGCSDELRAGWTALLPSLATWQLRRSNSLLCLDCLEHVPDHLHASWSRSGPPERDTVSLLPCLLIAGDVFGVICPGASKGPAQPQVAEWPRKLCLLFEPSPHDIAACFWAVCSQRIPTLFGASLSFSAQHRCWRCLAR